MKVPRAITHEHALAGCEAVVERFLGEVAGLGDKLGPLLVQLPPSRAFDARVACSFFAGVRARFPGLVACEPRHASWFEEQAGTLLQRFEIARVAADPARVVAASVPGGSGSLVYFRLHGSPRQYYSDYDAECLHAWTERVRAATECTSDVWCIFDNTALGAAVPNGLAMVDGLGR